MNKLGVVVALTMVNSAANAADLVVVAPAPIITEETFDWTGFYVGAHAGWGRGNVSGSNSVPAPSNTTGIVDIPTGPFDNGDLDLDGWFGGGQVGYMWQGTNNWVGGLEADISFASIKDDFEDLTTVMSPVPGDFGVLGNTKIDMFGTVHGKVGYAYDRFLPFVTGGLAWARVKSELTTRDVQSLMGPPEIVTTTERSSATHFGWAVGAGVEYALTNHWRTNIEYRYHDFGKSFSNAFKTDIKTTLHTVRAGLNYKF